jgi:hypothetical protein
MNHDATPRKVIAQIRHACDGRLLHQPVRLLATPRRARRRALGQASCELIRLRREARFQITTVAVLGTWAILFVTALAAMTLGDAAGLGPKLGQGLAAIERFVNGLMS